MFVRRKKNEETHGGFTIIELIAVTAIIGILAGIVFEAVSSSRAYARDARRTADIQILQLALNSYIDDHGVPPPTQNVFPVCLGLPDTEDCWGGVKGSESINSTLEAYLQSIPTDPLSGRIYNAYIYRSPGRYWKQGEGTIKGASDSYSIAWQVDDSNPSDAQCEMMGGIKGRWDINPTNVVPPPTTNCTPGESCRQCGILIGSIVEVEGEEEEEE